VVLPPAKGAVHSAEIEYAMGNLATNVVYAWTEDDYRVSEVMQGYFANFIQTGDPNGPGLPAWPAANQGDEVRLMRLDVASRAEPERHRERYLFHDRWYAQARPA
jgi:para-nitrobenzyl esterase